MNTKSLEVTVKLQINAGEATNREPIGPTLGQYGASADKFCEAFNKATTNYISKTLLRTKIYIYSDKSFEFKIRVPSISFFIKNALSHKGENEIDLYNLERKPGYFNEVGEYLPVANINIVYTLSKYLLSLDIYETTSILSLFKKIKSSLKSQGVLYISE